MGKPIILFDGVCNYCIGWVNFIIKKDSRKRFLFSPLQSETGQRLISNFIDHTQTFESVMLIYNDKCYLKSDVTIFVGKNLGGIWFMLSLLIMIVPRFIRNGFYDLIARNRYKWFGKKDSCMIPTPDISERFL